MSTPPPCGSNSNAGKSEGSNSGAQQLPLAKPMLDLVAWDNEMDAAKSGSPVSYEKMHEQMAQAAKDSPDNLEILSRLAQATYSLSLNLTDQVAVKEKTVEALNIAEKVVAMDANNFRGHLWQAMASGKLALLGCTVQEKIKYTVTFLRALAVCIRLNPKDPMVLFMEGRFQLALSSLTEEEKAAIKAHLPLPANVNWAEAEAKLRQSIATNAAFLDGYLTLAYLLIKAKKYIEAKEVLFKGLQQLVATKSDEQIAAEMKGLQERINSIVPK